MTRKFAPGWRMTLFTAFFLPVVLSLGVWQLNRAEEKRNLEQAYLTKLMELPVTVSETALATEFQRLRLKGRFTEEVFLIDNQVENGVVGYWVVHAFEEASGRKLLLNRGFVSGGRDRNVLPEVVLEAVESEVIGVVWPFTGLIPVLDEDVWTDGWPKRIQRMDVQRMADVTAAEPTEIRLEAGRSTLSPAPFASRLSDDTHRGYAATWFGLAVTLTLLFAYFGITRARELRVDTAGESLNEENTG